MPPLFSIGNQVVCDTEMMHLVTALIDQSDDITYYGKVGSEFSELDIEGWYVNKNRSILSLN